MSAFVGRRMAALAAMTLLGAGALAPTVGTPDTTGQRAIERAKAQIQNADQKGQAQKVAPSDTAGIRRLPTNYGVAWGGLPKGKNPRERHGKPGKTSRRKAQLKAKQRRRRAG